MDNHLKKFYRDKCEFIKAISKHIWFDLIRFHSANVNGKETHYTSLILREILLNKLYLNFSIHANQPTNEHIWGSDIDIYVEDSNGSFDQYAFQSKILKKNRRYTDLNRHNNGSFQYEKLEKYGVKEMCPVYYLFYNGVEDFKYKGENKCQQIFDETQFGLSYVSINEIKKVINNKTKWTFDYFHPNKANPLSEIICCKNSDPNPKYKKVSFEEISKRIKEYKKIDRKNLTDYFNHSQKGDKEERKADIILIIRNDFKK